MALEYNMNSEIGKLHIKNNNVEHEIKIVGGNCLAIFIYPDNEKNYLYYLILSVQHGLHIINEVGSIFFDEIEKDILKVELNARHRIYRDLSELLILSDIKFETYYQDIEIDMV